MKREKIISFFMLNSFYLSTELVPTVRSYRVVDSVSSLYDLAIGGRRHIEVSLRGLELRRDAGVRVLSLRSLEGVRVL